MSRPNIWIGVLVDQALSHAGGVLLIDTEDYDLLVAATALIQELRDLPCDQLSPVVENQHPVEVFGTVDAHLNLFAFTVELGSGLS